MTQIFSVAVTTFLMLLHSVVAQSVRFETGNRSLVSNLGQTAALWDILDLQGDSAIFLENDWSMPSGYGTQALRVQGGEVYLFAKGLTFEQGTVVVLWKDDEPLNVDADGVICFQADYPQDLAEAHNLKQRGHHFWLEQDADDGFQIKEQLDQENTETRVDLPGVGLTQDPWNQSGWIWQKLTITGDRVKAKFWSATIPEPYDWQIDLPNWQPKPGRVGLKVFSGHARIAYFAISQEDVVTQVPPLDLTITPAITYHPRKLQAKLFLNTTEFLQDATISLWAHSPADAQEAWRGPITQLKTDIPQGPSALIFGASDSTENSKVNPLLLPENLPEGKAIIAVEVSNVDETRVFSATRPFEYRSPQTLEQRILAAEQHAHQAINKLDDREHPDSLNAKAALGHLQLAQERISQGKAIEAEGSVVYAEEALDSNIQVASFAVGKVVLSANSMVMGETYELQVTWKAVADPPQEPLTAQMTLSDDIRVMEPLSVTQPIAPTAWNNNEVVTTLKFRIPEEFPKGRKFPIDNPAIREGSHRVWISLLNAQGGLAWIDAPQPDIGDFRTRHEVARVYVTQNPFEISECVLSRKNEEPPEALHLVLRSLAKSETERKVSAQILTPSRKVLWTTIQALPKDVTGEQKLNCELPLIKWFGPLKLELKVYEGNHVVTQSEQDFQVVPPFPWQVTAHRNTQVIAKDGQFRTTIQVSLAAVPHMPHKGTVQVWHRERYLGTVTTNIIEGLETGWQTSLEVEPALGQYLVRTILEESPGTFWTTEQPVIAPVFENRKGTLYLNGEPFIVKGLNVHGMIPHSPERNRQMLRFLKEVGFNLMRGDYPPLWQIDQAEEENVGYMVLPPFSVNSTDLYKKMYAPHPFSRIRELTCRFIEVYRDKPAMWLWNSCNEVTNEIEDFLVTLYPLYKDLDPAERPVIYANLYGQDKTLGQDVMAVNYYFGVNQTAMDRQPLIQRSLQEAWKVGIPCIFTEFNCWYGPVYSKGIEALRGIFEYGLSIGMSGGFLYLLADDSPRHPGVIASRENLWSNPSYIAALHHAFDDVEVETAVGQDRNSSPLILQNRRAFGLRKIQYEVDEGSLKIFAGTLDDLAPLGNIGIPIGDVDLESPHTFKVELTFESHFGLRSHVVQEVLYNP